MFDLREHMDGRDMKSPTRGTPTPRKSRAPRLRAKGAGSRGGTRGSTRRPPDEARRRIIETADRLFYEEGIRGVGVDTIAAAAEVTKRTLYYHFASKEDLVAAYLEARDEVTLGALRTASSDAGARPGDRIVGVFEFIASWSASKGYRGCPFNNAIAEQGSGAKTTTIARSHKTAVKSWFVRQASEGGAADPDTLGERLLVLLDGALNGAAVFRSPAAAVVAREMAEKLIDENGLERSGRRSTKERRRR